MLHREFYARHVSLGLTEQMQLDTGVTHERKILLTYDPPTMQWEEIKDAIQQLGLLLRLALYPCRRHHCL